ncbi:MFS transporter [Leekyejoonella antrihumi]|uniref:MFS transporter n=1 Tax=Leekyejoonella antrihumi TaxID=1660198 RepID=A0A563E4A6_9MICO|nr:MFS transporter [Leekyejoonella antrihumi]TWP37360.1 MFS transporter [Leekyejoonella antrihumi]
MNAAASTDLAEPVLIDRDPPPISRDRMILAWLGVVTVSYAGDAAWLVALAWTAVRHLDPTIAGLVVAIGTAPQALLMLVGGVVADRFDPRRVLALGAVGQGLTLVVGATLWPARTQSAGVLFGIALAFGVAAGLTLPSLNTLRRQIVRAEDLTTLSGWTQVAGRLARLLGAPVGAFLVARAGLAVVMLVDAATFAAVALVMWRVVRPRYRLPKGVGQPHWFASLRDGLHYLATTPVARTFVIGLSSLNVFVSPVIGIGVALSVNGSHWSSTWLGWAEAAFAAGAIGGSMLGIRWRPPRMAAAGFRALIVQGAAIALVGVSSRGTLLGAMLLLGLTAGLASVWLSSTFLLAIAPSHLGRVSSVNNLGDLMLLPLVTPAFAACAQLASVLAATVTCGAAMALLCAVFAMRPEIRSLRQP